MVSLERTKWRPPLWCLFTPFYCGGRRLSAVLQHHPRQPAVDYGERSVAGLRVQVFVVFCRCVVRPLRAGSPCAPDRRLVSVCMCVGVVCWPEYGPEEKWDELGTNNNVIRLLFRNRIGTDGSGIVTPIPSWLPE